MPTGWYTKRNGRETADFRKLFFEIDIERETQLCRPLPWFFSITHVENENKIRVQCFPDCLDFFSRLQFNQSILSLLPPPPLLEKH